MLCLQILFRKIKTFFFIYFKTTNYFSKIKTFFKTSSLINILYKLKKKTVNAFLLLIQLDVLDTHF